MYLAALVSRFETTWLEPRRVAVHAQAAPRHVDRQRVGALLEQRAGHLDRLRDHLGELDELGLQLDLAARDARDVEQVVDQPRQVVDLALDDGALALRARLAAQPHQLQRRQDRRQRVAQLVAEHRQELVLRAVGALGGLAQAVHLLRAPAAPAPGCGRGPAGPARRTA